MTISVSVEAINATLEDFSDSWKTKTINQMAEYKNYGNKK